MLTLFLVGIFRLADPSITDLSVSPFPDPPEDIFESLEPKVRQGPVNEEHDRQVGDNEIVLKDNAQVQAMGHKFSFLGVIIHEEISMS